MEDWTVEFYQKNNINYVENWLDSLDEKTKTKITKNITLLREQGLSIKEPYVKKLEGKLWELRTKDYKGIYRVIYFTRSEKRFVMLHGFVKKTDRTPRKEIDIAKKRMEEVLDNG